MQTRTGAQSITWRGPVQVLVPYATVDGRKVSPDYDTPGFRAELDDWFGPLGLDWSWRPVCLADADTVAGLAPGAVAFNLCDGDELDGFPGLGVVRALELRDGPFTGADAAFYELSTSKLAMKERFAAAGVPTPPHVAGADDDALAALGFPLVVKPDVAAAGMGLEPDSVADGLDDARRHRERLRRALPGRALFAERFVDGPEFTVLVVAGRAWRAVEMRFDPGVPPHRRLLFHGHRATALCRYLAAGHELAAVAEAAYRAVAGRGYGRVDLRLDASGAPQVLEVNANCGLSRDEPTIARALDGPICTLVAAILDDAVACAA